jgi:hypothetical protein
VNKQNSQRKNNVKNIGKMEKTKRHLFQRSGIIYERNNSSQNAQNSSLICSSSPSISSDLHSILEGSEKTSSFRREEIEEGENRAIERWEREQFERRMGKRKNGDEELNGRGLGDEWDGE